MGEIHSRMWEEPMAETALVAPKSSSHNVPAVIPTVELIRCPTWGATGHGRGARLNARPDAMAVA